MSTAALRCTEDHLLDIAGAYLDSLTANDPAGAPLAPALRATENGVVTSTSEGLWQSARGWLYRHTFVDPQTGGIGVFGSIAESGNEDAIVGIRLKVAGGQITESEILIARKGDFALFEPRWASEPKAIFGSYLPPSRQTDRATLADIPRRYFEAIAKGDPRIAPAHPDCQRLENGVQTTMNPLIRSPSQSESLRRLVYMQHARGLRAPVVDVERGLVFCVVAIDMPMMAKTIMVRGKPHEIKPERHHLPRTLCLHELFKVENGRIRSIEAVMRNAPLGFDMGWS